MHPSRTSLSMIVTFVAAAAIHAPSASAATPTSAAAPQLPHGVHRAKNGRYWKDVCDHDLARHCHSRRLLAEAYRPGDRLVALDHAAAEGRERAVPAGNPPQGPIPGSMTPTDLLAAYSIPPSSKAGGQIVAIVDLPFSNAYEDLSTYRSAFGLPKLPRCTSNGGLPDGRTPCFAVVDEDGNPNPTNVTDGGDADGETSLDMDMVSAACPDCSILFVAMTAVTDGNPADQDFVQSAQTAGRLGAVATSISWGGPEGLGGGGPDPTGYTTPGHLVVASSGDTGYLMEDDTMGGGVSPQYPSSAPDVLGVGGTNLTALGNGQYTQTVWNDEEGATTSGCSTEYPMPAFQKAYGASKFGPCTQRATTDVSAAAEFTPAGASASGGIASYQSVYGGWVWTTGTSAAAPIVAATFVRLGIAVQVSNDFGFVYRNASAFGNVTMGSNDNDGLCVPAGNVLCTAGPGWNGPTGVGAPTGLLATLAGQPSPPPPVGADAGTPSGSDAGTILEADAGADAGTDDSPQEDAATDASPEPTVDAAVDSASMTPTPYPTSTGSGGGSGLVLPPSSSSSSETTDRTGTGSGGPGAGGCTATSKRPTEGAGLWAVGLAALLATGRRRRPGRSVSRFPRRA
jgi:uncharacterized protein (TIGR03382 family)